MAEERAAVVAARERQAPHVGAVAAQRGWRLLDLTFRPSLEWSGGLGLKTRSLLVKMYSQWFGLDVISYNVTISAREQCGHQRL